MSEKYGSNSPVSHISAILGLKGKKKVSSRYLRGGMGCGIKKMPAVAAIKATAQSQKATS